MEINNTKAFAEEYKRLVDYFYGIAPLKKAVEEVGEKDEATGWISYTTQEVTVLDKDGIIENPIPHLSITLEEFSEKADLFIEELNQNVTTYSNEINKAVLLSCFGKIGFADMITPTRRMFIDAGLYNEAILLDELIKYKDLIYRLQDDGILGEMNGIEQYKEEITNNSNTHKKEKRYNKQATIPKELNTEKAKALIQKAIQKGLCDNNYKWLKSKALLAYFADRASEHLNLGKGKYGDKIKTSWKPFETLFNAKGLSGAKNDYQKTGTLPDGYEIVDKLFE